MPRPKQTYMDETVQKQCAIFLHFPAGVSSSALLSLSLNTLYHTDMITINALA